VGVTTCLIGGSGFIGTWLVPLLGRSGRRVVIIDRRTGDAPVGTAGIEYREGDYGDASFLRQALSDVDEIVDLAYATVPGTSFADPVNDILKNLPNAVRLFEAATERSVRKVVFVSSGGTVYGQAQHIPISEDHPTNPISPYGITKLAVEKYAFMFACTRDLPVVCVRPSNAFGEGQRSDGGQGFIAVAIAGVLAGREIPLFGPNGTTRDYIHVSDVASGILAALERGRCGTAYNIGTGEGRTNRQILGTLQGFAEKDCHRVLIREFPSRRYDVRENVLDSARLRTETGWRPVVPFEEGVRRMWESELLRSAG
jgi:UDP-glucose 4-epimerase